MRFFSDYTPDLQHKLVRNRATQADLALNASIPSLALLSSTYGDETPLEWLKIQFGSLNDFAEVKSKISREQLEELSSMILSEYYYLNAAEICLFIARFKCGKYGQFYGSIDPLKITSALLEYSKERRADIIRKERESARLAIEAEVSPTAINYEQYIILKKKAEDGDVDAAKTLRL